MRVRRIIMPTAKGIVKSLEELELLLRDIDDGITERGNS